MPTRGSVRMRSSVSGRGRRSEAGASRFQASAWAPYAQVRPEGALEAWEAWEVERDWLRRRDEVACRWVLERARAEGTRPVLRVTSHAHHYRDADNPFSGVALVGAVVTHSSGHADGPTLVPWANARSAADGMLGARKSSILLHEGPSLPLIGWAMHLGALNLRTLCPEPDTRSPEQVQLIEAAVDQLYGGRTSASGKRAAKLLPELAESGLSWALVVGSLLAIEPQRLDLEALEKAMPPAWRDEVNARRDRSLRQ